MTSQYTWESVTTPHDFGSVLGRPVHTFFCALTVSWSRLLARVWSDPYIHLTFTHLLCRSLKRSGNRTWTGSTFFTNESAWSEWWWALSLVFEVALSKSRILELKLKQESQQWHDLWAVGGVVKISSAIVVLGPTERVPGFEEVKVFAKLEHGTEVLCGNSEVVGL